jgi:predicted ATPase/DNA-binding CsgD family transcriptional regulator/transcriptional regulator with XRE-family HTH domain
MSQLDAPLEFDRWLKRLRAAMDVTQDALAERVGCSTETIRAFESGRRRPSRAMAERLADVLQLTSEQRSLFLRSARGIVERMPLVASATSAAQHLPQMAPQPYATAISSPARLPSLPNILIGRQAEQAEIKRRLSDPVVRLLTLVGPGGIGKTRLALQVAADLTDQFPDGAAFVALAQVMAAEHLSTAIAGALDLAFAGAQAPDDALVAALRDRRMLLVLDNFEHLLDATPLLAAILREAPGVRLLVTSRERLRLQAERVFELNGLATPHDDTRIGIDRSDAVLLFLERARQHRDDFALAAANRAAVAQICQLVDGMPLGIELAAAWVRVLSPDEIVAEVRRSLDFLTLNDRDADPRHRSMRAVIDHSWGLLTDEERRVMARLSIFRGGCQRGAAERVAGVTLPALLALLDKSLLQRSEGSAGAARYEMHELVRQYAADQLEADPHEAASARDQHCAYYATWINARKPTLQSQQQHLAVAEIMTEIDNLRAAWQHAVDQRQIEPLWLMSEGTVLLWFHELRSWYQEGEAITRRAADALRAAPLETRQEEILLGTLTGCHGWYTFRCGRPDLGLKLLEESLEILAPGDHPLFLLFTLEQLSYLTFFNGEFERAVTLQEQMLALSQRIDDPWVTAHALFLRAAIYADHMPEISYARFQEGLPHIRAVGDRYHLSLTLNHMGEVALARGELGEAEQHFAEALRRSAEIGNGVSEVSALNGLAMVACARQAWGRAIAHCLEALARARDVGDQWSRAKALVTLGHAEAGGGDHAAARRSFKEAIEVSLASRTLPTAISAWVGLAALDIRGNTPSPALLTILAHVRRHDATSRHTAERANELWAALAARLDAQTLAGAEHAASLLSPEQLGQLLGAYAEGLAAVALEALLPPFARPHADAASEPPAAPGAPTTARVDSLSPREIEVLRLLANGASNPQIAERLVISIHTVKAHVAKILDKLEVSSRHEAMLRARELGVI